MSFPPLPPSVVARILSFNVGNYKDVADLRLLKLVTMLPSLISEGGNSKHHIAVPPKIHGNDSFVFAIAGADGYDFESHHVTLGEKWDYGVNAVMNLCNEETDITEIVFLGLPEPSWRRRNEEENDDEEQNDQAPPVRNAALMMEYRKLADKVAAVETRTEVTEIHTKAKELGLFEPVAHAAKKMEGESEEEEEDVELVGPFMVLVRFKMSSTSVDIVSKTQDEVLILATTFKTEGLAGLPFILPASLGAMYRAVILDEVEGTLHCALFVKCVAEADCFNEYSYTRVTPAAALSFEEIVNKFQKRNMVEGVAVVDGFVSENFRKALIQEVNNAMRLQADEGRTDYHPNSNQIVRDIVHPALYPYIKDVSILRGRPEDVEPATVPDPNLEGGNNNDAVSNISADFWGRHYEDSIFQWMPTYFEISPSGQCQINDYINNLVPREQYSELYISLARLFEQALPYVESVYSYVQAVCPQMRGEEDDDDYNEEEEVHPLEIEHVSLRGQRLQVITKIVDYELLPQQSHSGVWHVEGMSHEEIVLTCLYILDRDETISGGELDFKRAFLKDEASAFVFCVPQVRHPRLDEIIRTGLCPLGRVATPKGRLIVFPNSHVHKVNTMLNDLAEGGVSKRRIVVFFLINPLKRIVSTREVAPQQQYAGGKMALDEAEAHRLRLMEERRYHKQDWNVREVELCEH